MCRLGGRATGFPHPLGPARTPSPMPRCAVCGQDNPGFRFCGACGASLAGPARAPAEERRLVTGRSDLVGFTARSDQADPEDVGALLAP